MIRDPDDLPALYRASDSYSLRAQRRFLRGFAARLTALLVAGTAGAISWGAEGTASPGWVAFIAFLVALAIGTYLGTARPDRAWYEGRAAAESAKTLSWRYMVKAESYEPANDSEVERVLLSDLRDLLTDLGDIEVTALSDSSQITSKMRDLRAMPYLERKAAYRAQRLETQHAWYVRKSESNRRRSRWWFVATTVAEFAGVVAGALMAFNVVEFDLLGIVAAAAASATAWTQAKQHSNLATAYAVTALELSSVISELDALPSEDLWATFVGDAEEAISREHTLWRASRGLRVLSRRRKN